MDKQPLSELQFNLKRDPGTYKQDFVRYYDNYTALEQSFVSAPSQYIAKLEELLLFISQVIQNYPEYTESFANTVIQALVSRSFGMHAEMRMAFMKAFMRLKTKDIIPMDKAIAVAFKLHRCHDKQVRVAMRNFVVYDIKRLNQRQKMNKLNGAVQTYLSKMLKDNNTAVGREAVLVLVRLFRKNIWNDARTVNLIADACLAKRKKVYAPAVRFFLGDEKSADIKDSDSDSDADVNSEAKIKQLRLSHRVGTKTNRRQKRLERSIDKVNKVSQKKEAKGPSFMHLVAVNLIHDPQTFAERMLRKLERCSDRFEIRLLLVDLVTRLIGIHKLVILNFYPFIQRFLKPHQREVTRLLLYAAQASHDEVPPDVIEPVIRAIADNFITERASAEAIAFGLNSVREICARCPYGVSTDLLSDLVQYRSYRNKNVVSAARSLIRLYRQINPSLLPRKERGRPMESQVDPLTEQCVRTDGAALAFGQSQAMPFAPGTEALVLARNLVAKSKKGTKRNKKSVKPKDEEEEMEEENDEEESEEEDEVENADGSLQSCSDEDDDSDDDDEEEEEEEEEEADSVEEVTAKNGKVKPQMKANRKGDEDDWIDVDHSSNDDDDEDEAAGAGKGKVKMDPTEVAVKALDLASSRVFTQEEFEAMRRFQVTKQKRFASLASRNSKRQLDAAEEYLTIASESDEEAGGGTGGSGLVSMSAITRLAKRPRLSKAERLESMQDGRTGREKFGFKINRMNPHASTTNREKSKGKAFPMIKHKVKRKCKRSFRDKQIALRDHLKRMEKQKH